jgi:3-methyladenine DNA glycosylase AlkD
MSKISDTQEVLDKLRSFGNPAAVKGMVRFGIASRGTLGVSMPVLRKLAKDMGQDHTVAVRLWNSRIHEARILAGMVDQGRESQDRVRRTSRAHAQQSAIAHQSKGARGLSHT